MIRRVIGFLRRKLLPPPPETFLLEMILPAYNSSVKQHSELPSKYTARFFSENDLEKFNELLIKADMGICRLEYWHQHILPNGFFVIEDTETSELVATCFASHHPDSRHPYAGNLGWLAVDPAHRGNNLGSVVVSSVMNRLQQAGYKRIYLETHEFRLPAIKIYLKLGWIPYIYRPEMYNQWESICSKLKYSFTPDEWERIAKKS